MSARHKLNAASIRGILLIAGFLAAMAGSWPLFWVLLVVLLASAIHSGDIRLEPRR
jgi:integral membrane sensor domain MASE1